VWGVFVLAVLFAGLTTRAIAQLYAAPIATPGKPYQMEGYEIMPPQGPGWFEMKRERHFVYFGKRLVSPSHSFIIIALSAPVDETFEVPERFRDHVARQLAENPGDTRNKITVAAVELDPESGPYCVRYQTKAEDRGAANARGRTLLAETFGLSCLHPTEKMLAIDVSYTERGLPSEIGTLLRDEGENFVRSMKFTPRR
jgi:hypothetical protein